MTADFLYDVFLSHNSKDKPRVRKLAERLKAAGLSVWFDEWNIRPGEIISLKVDEGLEQSRVLLLCISANALASGWVALERSTAIHRDPANESRRFVPLLLADCDLPDSIRRYKYVDFRNEAEAAFAELLTVCRPEINRQIEMSVVRSDESSRAPGVVRSGRMESSHDGPVDEAPLGLKLNKWLLPQASSQCTITRLAWSTDGKFIATPSHCRLIWIWNIEEEKPTIVLKGHRDAVYAVAWSQDNKVVASGSWDRTIRVWDVSTGQNRIIAKDQQDINALSWKPNSSLLAAGAESGPILLFDMESGGCVGEYEGHSGNINNLVWSPDGRFLAAASGDRSIRVWEQNSKVPIRTLKGHGYWAFAVSWSPDGKTLASGSFDHTVRCWDVQTGREICVLEGHKDKITSCSFSSDGRLLATKSKDHSVKLWRSDTWQQVATLEEQSSRRYSSSLSFNPAAPVLATLGNSDTAIRIWNLDVDALLMPQSQAGPRRYVSAKVVLLGEGTVGKTSLAHRLVEDKYVVRDRTHGMNVWRLDLPLSLDPTMDREVLLWDLAGQEHYRLIHQLFLEETALALLLVNSQKNDPFAEAGDWLKALQSSFNNNSRSPAKLLIFSQVDVGGIKLGTAKIDRILQQYDFADWLPTSAKTGENCSDKKNGNKPSELKQLIATSIPWDELPWITTPRLLTELKNALMAMRDQRDIRLLRFAELTQRLEQAVPDERFGEADVLTAVTLLANHGLVRILKFGDLVLLQPELLNGYAAAIIRAAGKHTDEIGCVLETDIYKSDFDFIGVERLKNRSDEELLLRALVQTFLEHSLCIAEDTAWGRQLVFPSQYRREKDIPRDPEIFVSYTFSGEWQTIWTTLVVRIWYSQEFEHRELWRNAAEFSSPKGHTLGLKIDNKQGEGTATISLYFDQEIPDELKSIFIKYVHSHLAKYATDASRVRRYVCPDPNCRKPVTNLEAVRHRLEANKTFITCQYCNKRVPLVDFIEQRLRSDSVARKVLDLDRDVKERVDTQALEQVLIGHMMAITGEANQIFRPTAMFDYGIDGEVEFKDDNGKASGNKIYIQLKSGNSYLRTRKRDGSEIFDVKKDDHLTYWISQPVDVYLVIRQTDEIGASTIRWMNVTRYLKQRKDKDNRQIVFKGEKLDMEAVWKVRDQFFPPNVQQKSSQR
jgi:WD40 repeat protein/RNase P subunit RPR2